MIPHRSSAGRNARRNKGAQFTVGTSHRCVPPFSLLSEALAEPTKRRTAAESALPHFVRVSRTARSRNTSNQVAASGALRERCEWYENPNSEQSSCSSQPVATSRSRRSLLICKLERDCVRTCGLNDESGSNDLRQNDQHAHSRHLALSHAECKP